MGRGDKRTKKGKTFRGSYGNARPKSISPKANVNTQAKKEEGGKEKKEVAEG
jgi:30S ribosomal protein S31